MSDGLVDFGQKSVGCWEELSEERANAGQTWRVTDINHDRGGLACRRGLVTPTLMTNISRKSKEQPGSKKRGWYYQ
jgi:hypothetical protein